MSNAPLDQVQFVTPDEGVRIDVRIDRETVWLTQAQLSELFGRDQSVISRHVRNVFQEGELAEKSNIQKMHIASSDRPVTLHSLDVIISVGYRVKSHRGTQFRMWATRTLKERLLRDYQDRRRLEGTGIRDVRDVLSLAQTALAAPDLGGNLLYFLIKDHPFTDGNERVGSLLFLLYLDKNGRLLRPDGSLQLDDNALVALALLIAESNRRSAT